jgi:excisionase family DNA binding protein
MNDLLNPSEVAGPPTLVSPYLTVAEAAAYLRTTTQGIYSLVKRGKVQPMPGRPGRLLFTREALDKYLNRRFRR